MKKTDEDKKQEYPAERHIAWKQNFQCDKKLPSGRNIQTGVLGKKIINYLLFS